MQILDNNTLIIKFDGIELSAAIANEAASQGHILFSISPKNGLADGTVIHNQAGIYFDENEVVLTEATKNTLYDKPTPEANFSYKHNCSNTGLAYDFKYEGATPDGATYYWEFQDATPATSVAQNPSNIVFANTSGTKLVKLTINRNGCSESVIEYVLVENVLTNNGSKVTICHNGKPLSVNTSALASHLAHGDCVGSCPQTSAINARLANTNEIEQERAINELSAKLFPNPTNKEFTIQLSETGEAKIVVMDIVGKVLKETVSIDANVIIDLSDLNNGLYFVQIIQNGKLFKEKIIKQ
jgi:PKD repeat protein